MLSLGAASKVNKKRFNLLLLEEQEYYFEDYGGFIHLPPDAKESTSSSSASSPAASTSSVASGRGAKAAAVALSSSSLPSTQSSLSVPVADRRKLKGRIHVCSKSLMFDADEIRQPIIRLPFRDITLIKTRQADRSGNSEYFVLHCKSVVEMALNSPYSFRKLDATQESGEYAFSLSYVTLAKFMPLLTQLHAIEKMPEDRATGKKRSAALAALVTARESTITFDNSWIVDVRERALLPNAQAIVGAEVTPLVVTPGCIFLTDQRLYFQPFNNVMTDPVMRYNIADIQSIYKRRHVMRDVGLEFYYSDAKTKRASGSASTKSSQSAYLSFKTVEQRNTIYDLIVSNEQFTGERDRSLAAACEAWCRGELSNYDYLMILNQHGGRSFQDLTQYPVFPWVLADYESATLDLRDPKVFRDLTKPMGAINPKRLESFKTRMREMPVEMSLGKPFLYGTHYSSPGYVLFYLVRKAPEYQLRLQNGRFDHADRLFTSIAKTWESCTSAPTDVKELTPEFYSIDGRPGDFLQNDLGLDLGVRQNGREVDDVVLPPWVESRRPREFVAKLREALECTHVSQNLHHWIDLIFGYKQTGDEAVKADNVFYYLTYEGAVDIDSVDDPMERRSIEGQISEFGQTPKQIFFSPHPVKGSISKVEIKSSSSSSDITSLSRQTSSSSSSSSSKLSKIDVTSPVSSSTPSSQSSPQPSSSSLQSSDSRSSGRNRPKRPGRSANDIDDDYDILPTPTLPVTIAPLSAVSSLSSPVLTASSSLSSSLDMPAVHTLTLEDDDLPPVVLHELDLPPGLLSVTEMPVPVSPVVESKASSSSSATVRPRRGLRWPPIKELNISDTINVHREGVASVTLSDDAQTLFSVATDGTISVYSLPERKQTRRTKVGELALSACVVSRDERTCVLGNLDNHIYIYSVGFGRVVSSIPAHESAVSCLCLNGDRLVSGSWDATVKVWQMMEGDITKRPIMDLMDHETAVQCCAVDPSGNIAATGSEDGVVMIWDLRKKGGHIRTLDAHAEKVVAVHFIGSGIDLLTASSDGEIKQWETSSGAEIETMEANETLRAMQTDGYCVVAAGDRGTLRTWSLKNHKESGRVDLKSGAINCFAISDDGDVVVTGLSTKKDNIGIWKRPSVQPSTSPVSSSLDDLPASFTSSIPSTLSTSSSISSPQSSSLSSRTFGSPNNTNGTAASSSSYSQHSSPSSTSRSSSRSSAARRHIGATGDDSSDSSSPSPSPTRATGVASASSSRVAPSSPSSSSPASPVSLSSSSSISGSVRRERRAVASSGSNGHSSRSPRTVTTTSAATTSGAAAISSSAGSGSSSSSGGGGGGAGVSQGRRKYKGIDLDGSDFDSDDSDDESPYTVR